MNREKIITREKIESYLNCSLAYRYQHELDMPYLERDVNQLFVKSAKYAVASWFNSLSYGRSKRSARNNMGVRLDLIWKNLGFKPENYPLAYVTIMQILLELETKFHEKSDLVIGGGFTATLPLKEWALTETLDGIFIKNGLKSKLPREKRPIIGVQISPDVSVDKNPNFSLITQTVVKYSLNVSSGELLGNGHPPKLFVVYVPSLQKRTFELSHINSKEAIWLASSVINALEANIFTPSPSLNKCKSCWYRYECSNYFTMPKPSVQKLAQMRESCQYRVE